MLPRLVGEAIHEAMHVNWGTLWASFGLVFLAELGDKTQLAVISQTCKCRRPWPVFLGASLALAAVTAIGVAGGEVVARLVPRDWLHNAAAAAFVIMGLLVARGAMGTRENGPASGCEDEPEDDGSAPGSSWNWGDFWSTFGLLFVAELGDKTQLAVLSLASRTQASWPVFWGATLALTAVTALGVVGGESLRKWIPERVLLWVSAGAFVVMGLLMATGVL